MYTASSAFLEALTEQGVSHVFANFGSDHPALVEAIAEARAHGRPIPEIITAPNEMVGMSAAQGFWQATGIPQAVLVHVECGTQALAGAVHNAAKGRIPMLIFAGASPFTQNGELRGSRNEFIQWIQDVHDQRGIVRGYMRYDAEIRTGRNIKELVYRAMQFANSDPKGPAYLMGAREVMEEEVSPVPDTRSKWLPVEPAALTQSAVERIGIALSSAKCPLVVTSFIGRNNEAVASLVALCERLGAGLLESVPNNVNFPHDHPLYQGNQWNEQRQNAVLSQADAILVLDSDVPWIQSVSRPPAEARIFHIDVDPLKEQMPLWHIDAEGVFRADAHTALDQILDWLDHHPVDAGEVRRRTLHFQELHLQRREKLRQLEELPVGVITPEFLISRLREAADEDTIFLNEGITNYPVICSHLMPSIPGSLLTSGGGSLGWNGGAAVGVKLALPERSVVSICGDGTFMFTVPSSVHWMARRYDAPFLQIVLDNRGWKAPKRAALAVHPSGYASKANSVDTSFEPVSDYGGIAAAAGGAWARKIVDPSEVDEALLEAFRVIKEERRCAVLTVQLEHH